MCSELMIQSIVRFGDVGGGTLTGLVEHVAWSMLQPFSTLWFIYMLAIFSVVTKLLRFVPAWALLGGAALIEIAPIHTGAILIDEFAARYVYFLAGYLLAPQIFRLAAWAVAHKPVALAGLALWAVVNGFLALTPSGLTETGTLASLPVISLVAGSLGAVAMVLFSALLAGSMAGRPLDYAGRHAIAVYLAFFTADGGDARDPSAGGHDRGCRGDLADRADRRSHDAAGAGASRTPHAGEVPLRAPGPVPDRVATREIPATACRMKRSRGLFPGGQRLTGGGLLPEAPDHVDARPPRRSPSGHNRSCSRARNRPAIAQPAAIATPRTCVATNTTALTTVRILPCAAGFGLLTISLPHMLERGINTSTFLCKHCSACAPDHYHMQEASWRDDGRCATSVASSACANRRCMPAIHTRADQAANTLMGP